MDELLELRQHILAGDYTTALSIVDELDEMSRKTTLRNIRSYLVRLLVHLIKNQCEARLTNSWAASIRHSVLEIQDLNRMENRRSYYIKPEEWEELLESAFEDALYAAADEVSGGQYTPHTLMTKIDQIAVQTAAQSVIAETYELDRRQMSQYMNEFLQKLPGGHAWEQGVSFS